MRGLGWVFWVASVLIRSCTRHLVTPEIKSRRCRSPSVRRVQFLLSLVLWVLAFLLFVVLSGLDGAVVAGVAVVGVFVGGVFDVAAGAFYGVATTVS